MKEFLSDPIRQRILGFVAVTLCLVVLFSVLNPRFMTVNNLSTLLRKPHADRLRSARTHARDRGAEVRTSPSRA